MTPSVPLHEKGVIHYCERVPGYVEHMDGANIALIYVGNTTL